MKLLWSVWGLAAGVLLLWVLSGLFPGGWVAIRIGHQDIELSLVMLFLTVVLFYGFLLLLSTFLAGFGWFSRTVRDPFSLRWRIGRRQLIRGVIELAEGRWIRAEKRLVRFARLSEVPLVNYLWAARAAQLNGADERRDRYLRQAAESTPEAAFAVELTQAELELARGQAGRARTILEKLATRDSANPQRLRLLARTLGALGDWPGLETLWPKLIQGKVLREAERTTLEQKLIVGRIHAAAHPGGAAGVLRIFRELKSGQRRHPEVVDAVVGTLATIGAARAAVEQLAESLPEVWSEERVMHLGRLAVSAGAVDLLAKAEPWAVRYPESASLHYVLGLLCESRGQRGRARAHFERSLSVRADPEVALALSQLLEELGDQEGAKERAREGLRQLVDLEKRM
jgi:HemY protein